MRENRPYGSEGGEAKSLPYPYQAVVLSRERRWTVSLFLLRLFRHPLETFLHLFHLTAKVVDVVFFGRRLRYFFRLDGHRGSGARRHERLEHRERLLEQFHVAANMFFERRERRARERVGQLLAEFFLLAGQRVDRLLEIFRHHHLHAVAVEADQLPEESGRQ